LGQAVLLCGAIVLFATAAGCFAPSYHDPACGLNGECPTGLRCMAGTCSANDTSTGGLDAPVDTLPPNCFGTGLDVRVCLSAPPSGDFHVTTDRMIDTTGGPPCDPDIATFCVIAGTAVQIDQGKTLGVNGTRPLVLVSTSELVIDGVLDVASHLNTPQHFGPGADSPLCHAGTVAANRGGGSGGSLGTTGGNGGPTGGALAGATLVPATLQGGCKGSDGAGGGQLGHGGGAVYLIATSISVNGSINASGESGTSTANDGRGGGGGGSGGMIVFDAPSLSIALGAQIFANGGGGGEGTGGNTGNDGIDASGPSAGGLGGSGASSGGDGGAGGFGTADGGAGAAGTDVNIIGGGGGGGGAGIIKVFRAPIPSSGMVSPPFS
jgi:hypothetical protein